MILTIILSFITSALGIAFLNWAVVNRQGISNQLFLWFRNDLDREHAADVGGDFVAYSFGDCTYRINYYLPDSKFQSGHKLEYCKDDKKITLLNNVLLYELSDWNLHVLSSNGYAVIDRYNVVRIYTSEDRVSLENVYYINSFEEFTKEEQEIFKSLMPLFM